MPYKDADKQKEFKHQHFLDNKEKYRDSHRRSKQKKAEWLRDLKRTMCCIKCGYNHPAALEFHHPNGRSEGDRKKGGIETISYLMRKYTKEKILEEIKKCDVLCANCHRIEHLGYLYE